jgi:hypothetical protein
MVPHSALTEDILHRFSLSNISPPYRISLGKWSDVNPATINRGRKLTPQTTGKCENGAIKLTTNKIVGICLGVCSNSLLWVLRYEISNVGCWLILLISNNEFVLNRN